EMRSVKPVFILPGALAERSAAIVAGLHASATQGIGQFCTNPGLIVLQRSPIAEQFVKELAAKLIATPEGAMLTPGIRKTFVTNTAARAKHAGVKILAEAKA